LDLETHINVKEQRHWNKESSWINRGDEWNHELGMDYMWENLISPSIKPYAKGKVLEIACGFGRITHEVLERCPDVEYMYVSDLNETCISKCAERFGKSVSGYFVNDGSSLEMVPSDFLDFVFSYDSFVHIHMDLVVSYVGEIARILKPGGFCSLHVSNLHEGDDLSFNNLGGRANFDAKRFEESLALNNLSIISETPILANHFSEVEDMFFVLKKG